MRVSIGVVIGLVAGWSVVAAAQDRPAAAAGAVPRLADGKPDMQGYWLPLLDSSILLEAHPAGFGVNARDSIIADPPDGKFPYQPWALAERDRRRRPENNYEDPQGHCFLSGAPRQMFTMVNTVQIQQPPGHVLILFEYIHAYRTIRIGGSHLPAPIHTWEGDSIARWAGDTLVVDTTNFNGKTWLDMTGDFVSDAARVTERFTMVDADTIEYVITIDDAKVYTRPWTSVTLSMKRNREKGYELMEHSCHEGNVDLEHVKAVASPAAKARGATRGDVPPAEEPRR
jgi:hypothetical protein